MQRSAILGSLSVADLGHEGASIVWLYALFRAQKQNPTCFRKWGFGIES